MRGPHANNPQGKAGPPALEQPGILYPSGYRLTTAVRGVLNRFAAPCSSRGWPIDQLSGCYECIFRASGYETYPSSFVFEHDGYLWRSRVGLVLQMLTTNIPWGDWGLGVPGWGGG